jgi:hypothetical protein
MDMFKTFSAILLGHLHAKAKGKGKQSANAILSYFLL